MQDHSLGTKNRWFHLKWHGPLLKRTSGNKSKLPSNQFHKNLLRTKWFTRIVRCTLAPSKELYRDYTCHPSDPRFHHFLVARIKVDSLRNRMNVMLEWNIATLVKDNKKRSIPTSGRMSITTAKCYWCALTRKIPRTPSYIWPTYLHHIAQSYSTPTITSLSHALHLQPLQWNTFPSHRKLLQLSSWGSIHTCLLAETVYILT